MGETGPQPRGRGRRRLQVRQAEGTPQPLLPKEVPGAQSESSLNSMVRAAATRRVPESRRQGGSWCRGVFSALSRMLLTSRREPVGEDVDKIGQGAVCGDGDVKCLR